MSLLRGYVPSCSFAGAFDWANTTERAFAPVLCFNDTFSMPDDGSDIGSKYTRKPQLLNMAVNSWLSTVIGEGALQERTAKDHNNSSSCAARCQLQGSQPPTCLVCALHCRTRCVG